MPEVIPAIALVTGATLVLLLVRHARRRSRIRSALVRERYPTVARRLPQLSVAAAPPGAAAAFARFPLYQVHAFLDPDSLAALQDECEAQRHTAVRSYIPGHKKGGTLSYEEIHRRAPGCLALYHAAAMRTWLSNLVGQPVQVAADHDQSACSLLYYDQAGDHIGWHYDHNFYKGRHFTVLVALQNLGRDGGPSSTRLQVRQDDELLEVDTAVNTLVVFEGARVRHRATAVGFGEQRILFSMTYCTNPRIGAVSEVIRRFKDVAYFGPRALID